MAVESRLIVSWHVSMGRDMDNAVEFLGDLQQRLSHRVTLTTDGFIPYADAVDRTFGIEVDYGQLVKQYEGKGGSYSGAERTVITGFPDIADVSTS